MSEKTYLTEEQAREVCDLGIWALDLAQLCLLFPAYNPDFFQLYLTRVLGLKGAVDKATAILFPQEGK